MRLSKAAACWLVLGFLPFTASALGLGAIALDSGLNEPFSAEVPLQSVGNTDLNQMEVSLASSDTFDRYGLDKPAFLSSFDFAVVSNEMGQPVVAITSTAPVAEPFVTFLLDVKWASGRLLREYTVLLDPPIYDSQPLQPEIRAAETVAEPADLEPVVVREEVSGAGVSDSAVAAMDGQVLTSLPLDAGMEDESDAVAAAEESSVVDASQPAAGRAEASAVTQESVSASEPAVTKGAYQAAKGDTLWSIAERTSGSAGLTNNQMMMAIYRANPEAFLGNINALKAGAILRIPAASEVAGMEVLEANEAAREQHAAWSDSSLQAAETLPAADIADAGQLELVAPGAEPSVDSAGANAAASDARLSQLESELAESQRLLQVRDEELRALQDRINALEQTASGAAAVSEPEVEAVDDLADIASDGAAEPLTGDEDVLVEGIAEPLGSPFADDAAEELVEDSLAAELAEGAPEQVAESEPVAATAADGGEASFAGELLGSYWLWGGLGLVLLLAMFVARRRATADSGETSSWADDIEAADLEDEAKDFSQLDSFEDSIIVDEGDFEQADDAGEGELHELEADAEAEPAIEDELDVQLSETDVSQDLDPTSSLDEVAGAGVDDETETPLEQTISTGAPLNLDQADPVAEAEFHMAYGLYDQAAELLAQALDDDPDNRAYRVKLLEVYFVWENKDGFLQQAAELHASIADDSDADWNKVLILGKQLCPDSELFSGASANAPTADSMDLELSDDVGETDIDFSLGGTEVETLDSSALDANDAGELDFDLGAADESEESYASDAGDDLSMGLDFDLGADADNTANEADDSMSLDLTDAGVDEVDHDETTRLESDGLAETMESPTIATDMAGETMESPTLNMDVGDMGGSDALEATMESPTLDVPGASADTAEMPVLGEDVVDEAANSSSDTELSDLTSLDVDLSGLADLPLDGLDDLSVEDDAKPDIDSTLNQLDNTGELLTMEDMSRTIAGESLLDEDQGEEEESRPDIDSTLNQLDNTGELLTMEDMGKTIADDDATLMAPAASLSGDDADLYLSDLGDAEGLGDTEEQPVLVDTIDGDTEEQPEISADTLANLDSDVPEDATMTEVGTKLDLARAYIDMGDPDGARSILNEVLDEGGDSQQQEAYQLLEELGD